MATSPFNKFQNTEVILYTDQNKEFAIASGYDRHEPLNKNSANVLSVGIRWLVSRTDGKRPIPLGYPHNRGTGRWFIMPNDLAVHLLKGIKNSPSAGCFVNIPEIDKAIQTLNQQIARQKVQNP